jgi:hypothetical protein
MELEQLEHNYLLRYMRHLCFCSKWAEPYSLEKHKILESEQKERKSVPVAGLWKAKHRV